VNLTALDFIQTAKRFRYASERGLVEFPGLRYA
jgi:hypothetical protein